MRAQPPLVVLALCALVIGVAVMMIWVPTREDLRRYFSPETLATQVVCDGRTVDRFDDFTVEWFAGAWRAAEEPSLYLRSRGTPTPAARTYRFTWLPTFHPPVVVRVEERKPGAFWLVAKRLSGAGGYGPGQIMDRIERQLTPTETASVLEVISSTEATNMDPVICDGGSDGSRWIFEGVEAGKVHYTERWTPKSGPLRETGQAFLDLTGWTFARIY